MICVFLKQASDEFAELFPDKLTWNEWTLSGNDSNSLWADPKFLDAYSEIYVLDEDSPAWDLGIKQIELNKFGVQETLKYKIEYD